MTESLRATRASFLSSVLILLDLSAAFDTVNHEILLATLAELGIANSALSWFTSYLTNRTYQVTWNGSLSEPCSADTGVPQGSVLGPLPFSLYIRSLSSVITSHGFSYHCYADNTQLFLSFSYSDSLIANHISDCLADISTWTPARHLKLNLNKTELLFLPGKDCPHMDLLVTVEDAVVGPSPTARNLGVILAAQQICSLHLPDPTLGPSTRISRLDYCNSLLAGLPASAIKPFQHIQNAAALLVFNLPKFSHVTPLFRDLHWLPVAARIRFKTMVLIYKAVNETAMTCLQVLVRPHALARALRVTTSTSRLVPPSLRASKGRTAKSQLFSVLAPLWWNDLPADVRTAESITCFRKRLKTHLFRVHLDPA